MSGGSNEHGISFEKLKKELNISIIVKRKSKRGMKPSKEEGCEVSKALF